MKFPKLYTERLQLDPIHDKDVKEIFSIFSDPDVIAHYDIEKFHEVSEAANLINYFKSQVESGNGIRWAIRSKGKARLLGTCGFNSWNQYDHSAIIGYDLAKKHWGQGFAAEAVTAIINHIYSKDFRYFINRIEASILTTNTPSIALCEKLGFHFEGVLREKAYFGAKFHDMSLYSLLKKDWFERNA
ncbi:MAG: GNAT family N-acetyltransferase [Alteromonadaceae bacterium]|nr:GNAT family N-acetyltransferase [Alteromonadaceae bacterium]